MRVLHINSVPYGSTCRVMLGIAKAAQKQGIHCDTAAGYSTHPVSDLPKRHFQIGGLAGKWLHMTFARLTGLNGCFSMFATFRLIRHIRREKIDLLHLHNLHGWYVNLPILMWFLRRTKLPVVWTLHDCWAWTGQCAHYTAIGCSKWQSECHHCPQRGLYPQSLPDTSRLMHHAKKRWFASLPNVTLAAPSRWLAEELHRSFLRSLPVQVIPNGIDLSVFKPTPGWQKDRRFMVLGVAGDWTERKGLHVFIELAQRLDDSYRIVLVGISEKTARLLPSSITCLPRTQNACELARLYTAADVFVNPTYEDTFPTVNLEALACGTPVAAFEAGGSAECLDERCGTAVPAGDVNALENAIRRICTQKPLDKEDCIRRASYYDQTISYQAYMALYRQKAGASL